MALFEVKLKDGRSIKVNAGNDVDAMRQARHDETSRISSERHSRLNKPLKHSFSEPDSATLIKG